MNNKVILIILDGLSYTTGYECMGYLQALVTKKKATLYRIKCELPSLSRPLYECLLTGVSPIDSGIVNNKITRISFNDSIFSLASKQGYITAAAAYHWMSELFNRAPWDLYNDRFVFDEKLNIQNGCFYCWDSYPDEAVLFDAEFLIKKANPDFLLIHTMNIDDCGHQYGFNSSQYRNMVRNIDNLLSSRIEYWLNIGYEIIITSDHGMNNDCNHGGILQEETETPCYLIGNSFSHQEKEILQIDICGLVCEMLGLKHSKKIPDGILI